MFPKTSFALRGVRRALLCLTTLMLAMVSASGALAHSVAEGFARHAFAANVVLMSAGLEKRSRLPVGQDVADADALEQDTAKGKVWVVRCANPNASDAAKQDLYIFVDELGNVLTANHEGTL